MGTHVVECSQQQEEGEHIFRSRYPPVQVPDNVTLPDFVLHNVELYADRQAFVDATTGKGYTYGEVARDIRRFAKALRSLGLRKGRVVLVVLPNVPEYAIVALGIMAAGGVFSGANPTAHSSEIMKQVESADGKLIVSDLPTYHKVSILLTYQWSTQNFAKAVSAHLSLLTRLSVMCVWGYRGFKALFLVPNGSLLYTHMHIRI